MKNPQEKAVEVYRKMLLNKSLAVIMVKEIISALERNIGYTQCVIDVDYWKLVLRELKNQ